MCRINKVKVNKIYTYYFQNFIGVKYEGNFIQLASMLRGANKLEITYMLTKGWLLSEEGGRIFGNSQYKLGFFDDVIECLKM